VVSDLRGARRGAMLRINDLRLQKLQDQLLKIDEDEFRDYRRVSGKLSLLLKECIEEYPNEVVFLLCEAICAEASVTNNPFIGTIKYMRSREWYDVAAIVFNHIATNSNDEDSADEKEYVLLIDYITKWIDLNENYILVAKARAGKNTREPDDFREFLGYFFERIEEEVKKFLFHFCWSIYRGLPLYEQISTGKFLIVDDSNHDFIYS
jgi:hypothetical protein